MTLYLPYRLSSFKWFLLKVGLYKGTNFPHYFIFKDDFMSTFRVEKSVKHYLNQMIRVNIISNAY